MVGSASRLKAAAHEMKARPENPDDAQRDQEAPGVPGLYVHDLPGPGHGHWNQRNGLPLGSVH
jgi:hypothetical protein